MTAEDRAKIIAAKRGQAGLEIWIIPGVALLIMVLASWLLRPVIDQLLSSATIHQWDTTMLAWFRSRATPELDRSVMIFTLLGSPFAMTLFAFAGLSVLIKQRRWLLLFSWDVLFLGMWALTRTVKPLVHRARPAGAEQFLSAVSFSFPSTHAMSAVAGFGMMAFVLAELLEFDRENRIVLWLFTIVLMILIGTSRLYLGVHYLSDVLAGYLEGGIWLSICLVVYHRSQRQLLELTKSPTA